MWHMPRVRSFDPNSESEPVKKVVRRAPRRPKIVASQTVSEVKEEEVALDEVIPSISHPSALPPVRRRAPRIATPEAAISVGNTERSYIFYVVIVGIFLVSVGISAAIGFSDKGTIDVAARISEQNASQASGGGDGAAAGMNTTIPVQNSAPPSIPNGGLVGQGVLAASPLPPPPVDTSATSSSSTPSIENASTTPGTNREADESLDIEANESTDTPTTDAQ